MFQDLRLHYGLTRSDLSALTGRSTNYLLKAESLTFPTPPVALLDLYTQDEEPKNWAGLSEVEWEPMDRDILISQYRDAQRSKREKWLSYYAPSPNPNRTFCRQWVDRNEYDIIYPTEYRISQGLCVPAPAVYRAEKFGHISQPIKTALSDLIDYAASGRMLAAHPEQAMEVAKLLEITRAAGVVLYHV
jgi:hypothetical protein